MPNFTGRRFYTIVDRLSRTSVLYHNHFTSFWRCSCHLVASFNRRTTAERFPKEYARFVFLSRTHRSSARCSHLFRRKYGVGRKIEFLRTQTVCRRFVLEKTQNYKKKKKSNLTSVKPGEKKRMFVIKFKRYYFYVSKHCRFFSKDLKKWVLN